MGMDVGVWGGRGCGDMWVGVEEGVWGHVEVIYTSPEIPSMQI